MDKRTQIINLCMSVSMILIFGVALLPVLKPTLLLTQDWPIYVFCVGAIGTLVCKLLEKYKGDNKGLVRLYKLARVSSLCYVVSAFLLAYGRFFDPMMSVDWLAFLTAGAALQVYVSFRIASEEKKRRN